MVASSLAYGTAGNDSLQYMPSGNGASNADRITTRQGSRQPSASSGTASANLVSEYYSSDSLKLTYSNADGDSVSLSMEHVEYQKAMLNFQGDKDSREWKDIVDFIAREFERMQSDMVERFLAGINGEEPADETEKNDASSEIPGLPEYWNAENTSQRIVDFAVSFFGQFEGNGGEYLDTIRAAISEGFQQARDQLGKLPDEVGSLVSDTYDLVMKKLDEWAGQQGIAVEQQSGSGQTAAV
jgi:hypothetical protein